MRELQVSIPDPQGALRLGYVDWGDPAAPVVLCVHGLTRNARDFDVLAKALGRRPPGDLARCRRARAERLAGRRHALFAAGLCRPGRGLPGRSRARAGRSRRHVDGRHHRHGAGRHAAVAHRASWCSTMSAAACRRRHLAFIGTYLGGPPKLFADIADLERHLRFIHQGFGPLSDAEWAHLAKHSARAQPGGVVQHYDPAIAVNFQTGIAGDIDLWPLYDAVGCPTLLLRGGESPLLAGRRGRRDDAARAEGGARHLRRDRPRPGADGRGPDRGRAALPARLNDRRPAREHCAMIPPGVTQEAGLSRDAA